MNEVSGSARPSGGCLALSLETSRPSASVEEHGALAAALVRQEIERARAVSETELPANPADGAWLGFEGGRAVRAASDPREAADLAALWSMTTPVTDEGHETFAVAARIAVPNLDPREADGDLATEMQATSTRLATALDRATQALNTGMLERRERVERGQGELWLLVGSPCGLQGDGESDGG